MAKRQRAEAWLKTGAATIEALDCSTPGTVRGTRTKVGRAEDLQNATAIFNILLGEFELWEQRNWSLNMKAILDDDEDVSSGTGNNIDPVFSMIDMDSTTGEHQHVQGALNLLLRGKKVRVCLFIRSFSSFFPSCVELSAQWSSRVFVCADF